MAFRVLIAGGRHFTDYPLLRRTLDALLVNRLPDVELLTTGERNVPMLGGELRAGARAERPVNPRLWLRFSFWRTNQRGGHER
jgi:hypothetical protein